MAKQATLINEQGNKQVVDVGSQQASSLMGQGYQLMGASGKYTPTNQLATPATPATPATQNIPTGAVPISGAEYNTGELQKANFSNIQPIGNTLYGIPKAPIVPDIIPQGEFGKSQTPQVLSETQEKAKSMISFTDKQKSELEAANKRLISGIGSEVDKKNVDYAKSRGWVSSPTEEIPEPVKSTNDTLFETMSNLGAIRAKAKEEAMKTTGLDEKSQAIATAQSVANQLRTELQNQGILDIKEQDVIRAKPILTAQIQGQLEGLSREQKLDAMILQNNYNNALVEQEIAQGNYDRAREIVKETADDAYNSAREYIEALKFKAEIEDKAANKLDEELKYERDLALEGYVHIKSVDGLKGLREDQIYRDPVSNKIYMKPAPEVATTMEIDGVTYGFDNKGNKIANYGVTAKSKTGSGGGTTPTVGIPKDIVSQIEVGLLSQVGSDGYLNPADYNLAREDWIAYGGEPSDFDKKFSGRRNPKNTYYNVESKESSTETNNASNEDEIKNLKEQGYSDKDLKDAGYDTTVVDKVFSSTSGNWFTNIWKSFWGK